MSAVCSIYDVNSYDISDPVELRAAVTLNSTGAAYDPDAVRCQVRGPDGIIVLYVYGTDVELVRDAAGVYSLIYFPATYGKFYYRWEFDDTTGNARSGAEEAYFMVRYSRFVLSAASVVGGSGGGFDGGSP